MSETPIYCADICDDHPDARICEMTFMDITPRWHFHGEVVTFATYEDNKGIRELLAEGGKGKVLVVDGRGSFRRALCGGNIAAEADAAGWEGLIFHGCVRDQHEYTELRMGVKALGTTPMRPRTDGIAKINVPVTFGGITIKPGDYLYADKDGVIVLDAPSHG